VISVDFNGGNILVLQEFSFFHQQLPSHVLQGIIPTWDGSNVYLVREDFDAKKDQLLTALLQVKHCANLTNLPPCFVCLSSKMTSYHGHPFSAKRLAAVV